MATHMEHAPTTSIFKALFEPGYPGRPIWTAAASIRMPVSVVRWFFAFLLAAAGWGHAEPMPSADIAVGSIRVYKTPRRSEAPSVLPLPTRIRTPQGSGLQEHYQVVFSIPLAGVAENHLLVVTAEFEATNDCGYDIALGTWLMIGRAPTRTVPDASQGESYLSYPAGFNIINGNYLLPGAGDRSFMHHGFISRSSTFVIPKGMSGTWHVNLVAYAQTDKLDCKKGGGLTVERGNGQLNVIHFIAK